MTLLEKLKRRGSYIAAVKCPNCGFGSSVKVPRGISVADFVRGGKCKCDNCSVVFYPDEYSTEHFDRDNRSDLDIKLKPQKKKDLMRAREKLAELKAEKRRLKKEPNFW